MTTITRSDELLQCIHALMRELEERFCVNGAVISDKDITVASLRRLVQEFGTGAYGFNLSLEHYIARYSAQIFPWLPEIVEEFLPNRLFIQADQKENADVAFTAYYALSLIYKKEKDLEGLKKLTEDKYFVAFQQYPLTFEVRSRYYKRTRRYDEALDADEIALWQLEARNVLNYAVGISYASTVCLMYENGHSVRAASVARANDYIEKAIDYNPDYPKYHYLRGKLLFYSARSNPDYQAYLTACDEALKCINTANNKMSAGGAHYLNELLTYAEMSKQIRKDMAVRAEDENADIVFKDMSREDVKRRKDAVIASKNHTNCKPDRPNLKPGQKYFFVCYCNTDYKQVFCDLIEMYARKIPFAYDETLMHGVDWLLQVRNSISSEDCVGVIFYISRSTFLSSAVAKEITMVCEEFCGKKPYFCVNLEGNRPPSLILLKGIQETPYSVILEKRVDDKRLRSFLSAFPDDDVFTPRDPELGIDGTEHFKDLTVTIRKYFPDVKF